MSFTSVLEVGLRAESEEGNSERRKRVRWRDGVVRIVVRNWVEMSVAWRREEKERWERMRDRSSGVWNTLWAADVLSAIVRRTQDPLAEGVVCLGL